MQQRSDEWFAAKAGKFSASEMADLLSKKDGATRKNLIAKKVSERLTGVFQTGFTSQAMQHGIDTEPEARDQYFLRKMEPIDEEGFVDHPTVPWSGASPDGVVGEDGLVEIKCPNTATHIEYYLSGTPPKKYIYQMQWQMACTGRKWCDFVSYDPRMPEPMNFMLVRIERDDEMILMLQEAVRLAVTEVEETINKLKEVSYEES